MTGLKPSHRLRQETLAAQIASFERVSIFQLLDELWDGEEMFVIEAPHVVCSGASAFTIIKFDNGGLIYHFAQEQCICLGKVLGVFHDCPTLFLVIFLSENHFEVVGCAV